MMNGLLFTYLCLVGNTIGKSGLAFREIGRSHTPLGPPSSRASGGSIGSEVKSQNIKNNFQTPAASCGHECECNNEQTNTIIVCRGKGKENLSLDGNLFESETALRIEVLLTNFKTVTISSDFLARWFDSSTCVLNITGVNLITLPVNLNPRRPSRQLFHAFAGMWFYESYLRILPDNLFSQKVNIGLIFENMMVDVLNLKSIIGAGSLRYLKITDSRIGKLYSQNSYSFRPLKNSLANSFFIKNSVIDQLGINAINIVTDFKVSVMLIDTNVNVLNHNAVIITSKIQISLKNCYLHFGYPDSLLIVNEPSPMVLQDNIMVGSFPSNLTNVACDSANVVSGNKLWKALGRNSLKCRSELTQVCVRRKSGQAESTFHPSCRELNSIIGGNDDLYSGKCSKVAVSVLGAMLALLMAVTCIVLVAMAKGNTISEICPIKLKYFGGQRAVYQQKNESVLAHIQETETVQELIDRDGLQ